MSLRQLPKVQAFTRPQGYTGDAPSDALARWADMPVALAVTDGNVIEINDVIGEDWWTGGGFTSNRMSAALRSIGSNPVTVMINTPGGDAFEGLTIFNQLQAHPAKVTVQVMGLAASAGSIIAMAGDEIIMAAGAMMMIHNAWGAVVGNRNDLAAAMDFLGKLDAGMADIYAARTGKTAKEVTKMLDGSGPGADGTWLTAQEAVDQGFADSVAAIGSPSQARSAADQTIQAKRRVDAVLARQGLPRTERRALMRELTGKPSAADLDITSRADDTATAAMAAFLKDLQR